MAPTDSSPENGWVPRLLDLKALVANWSRFLLGPRQTGKTALIRRKLPEVRVYDLLDTAVYLALGQQPGRIAQELAPEERVVVIDEIQPLPDLLNEVHRLIASRGIRFLLTGSSARKLRRGDINLLGGRARIHYLHPLTSAELGDRFDLARAVERGLPPAIYFSDGPQADLQAYAPLYLQQEVVAEGTTRDVPAFSRFLTMAAHRNGTVVNFTNVASDAQVARTTVYEYFEILKDTLVLDELPAWRKTRKRKPLASSKHYFFDGGVVGFLQDRPFRPGTPQFGAALETVAMHELVSHRDYRGGDRISSWRSTPGFEVDFILGDHTAVEMRAKETVSPQDLKSLRALAEEQRLKRYLCVSLEPRPRRIGEVTVLHYRMFLQALWAGEYR